MTPEEWSRIQDLLLAAAALQPPDRAAYLDLHCRGGAERDQVESFLDSYERLGDFLEPPEVAPPFKSICWSGQVAGVYRIREELGRGGMGVVYKADDTSLLRTVALKFLPDEVAHAPSDLGSVALNRIVREARAASGLNHPNICTIYEVSDAGGHPFIAMEFVEGRPLTELIGECGLPATSVIHYGLQIADALAHAHKRGIIHRDLKPSNIMVTPEGRIKVLDFGLAKRMGPETRADRAITERGMLLGTPAYMAPEALRAEDADSRTDVWSLGMVLYQVLAGKLPFEGKSGVELFDAILREPLPPLPPRVPAALRQITARCLQKDPDKRYAGACDLKADLEKCGRAAERIHNRMSMRVLALAPGAVILIVLLAWITRSRGGLNADASTPERRIAVLPYRNGIGTAEGQAFCDGMQETITSVLAELEPLHRSVRVVPIAEIRTQKVTDAKQAAGMLGVNFVLTGAVERERDGIRISSQIVDARTLRIYRTHTEVLSRENATSFRTRAGEGIADLLQLSLPTAERKLLAAGESSREGAYEHLLTARGYLDRYDLAGNVDLAIQNFRAAISEDPQYALAYAGLAEAYRIKYWKTTDVAWLAAAQEDGLKAVEIDPKVALAHVTLGNVYAAAGRFNLAIPEFRSALLENPVSIAAYRDLAGVYESSGQLKRAEDTYLKAVQMRPSDWMALTMLGEFYFHQGRVEEAEPIFVQITRLIPDSQLAFSNLGSVYRAMNQDENALDAYRRSIAIQPTALAYLGLAATYFGEGKFSESAAMNEKAVALTGDTSYTALGNLAQSYTWSPPPLSARAPSIYQRAVAVANRAIATNPKDSFALSCRSVYESELGREKEALSDTRSAMALAPRDIRVAVHAAIVYERSGDRERALQAIRAAALHKSTLTAVAREPDLGGLQKDPRYRKLTLVQSNGQ